MTTLYNRLVHNPGAGHNHLEVDVCLETALARIESWWFASAFRTIAFLFLSCAVGMLIHALNWTVLAWVENRNGPEQPQAVRETRYHSRPLWTQVLAGPIIMIYEVLTLLLKAPDLARLTMDENVKSFGRDSEWRFQFLQEFYLHFGQFYAHTAYAFLLTTILGVACVIRDPCTENLKLLGASYMATCILFLFGRVQLSSLFRAETELAQYNHEEGGGSEV